jgi:hypothetical protein
LDYLIEVFKKAVGNFKIYKREFQRGDIIKTYGSNIKLKKIIKGLKFTKLKNGFQNTLSWYRQYNKIKNS